MKKKNNLIPIAIIVGALMVSISIYYVYENTPQAQMMKSCKKIVIELGFKKGTVQAELVLTKCLNGQL